MMNFYKRTVKVYENSQEIFTDVDYALLLDNEEAKDIVEELTWDNLCDNIKKYHLWIFTTWETKKGRKLKMIDELFAIKEWKKPHLMMKIVVTYEKDPSACMQDLSRQKVDKVIQYFTERVIKISLDKLL